MGVHTYKIVAYDKDNDTTDVLYEVTANETHRPKVEAQYEILQHMCHSDKLVHYVHELQDNGYQQLKAEPYDWVSLEDEVLS